MSRASSNISNAGFVSRYLTSVVAVLAVGALLLLITKLLNGPMLYILYPAFYWPVWFCACAFFALLPRFVDGTAGRVALSVMFVTVGLLSSYFLKGADSTPELGVLAGLGIVISGLGYWFAERFIEKFFSSSS